MCANYFDNQKWHIIVLTCIPQKGYIKEILKLQGFDPKFKVVVSNTQIKRQLGNSISINVLKFLLINILK